MGNGHTCLHPSPFPDDDACMRVETWDQIQSWLELPKICLFLATQAFTRYSLVSRPHCAGRHVQRWGHVAWVRGYTRYCKLWRRSTNWATKAAQLGRPNLQGQRRLSCDNENNSYVHVGSCGSQALPVNIHHTTAQLHSSWGLICRFIYSTTCTCTCT